MTDDLTRTSAGNQGSTPPPAPPRRGGRFVAGTVLAGRYRIVSLLGEGGMGEVYKADDLKLDHPVALKFLPETLAMSPAALARFHAEARIARQVSHPNVCRVYDIGDVDGLQFLTMEFIDGEDLASLLRRIGRLPAAKALEIARQLCAGVAAAHDAGVLHRDLKPHNVMIDGRGRARVTDFGVAALAREIRREHVVAGTPAYLAPEQLRGEDASVRSDVYALGLVLYEVFTGKRAVEASSVAEAVLHHSSGSAITTPSSVVRDLDPLVERVILRCLDRNPAARPASAIQVAAALPGGDPLQAALAAGETPSPEMVAAAGSHEAMRPIAGVWIAAATIAMILFVSLASTRFTLLGRVAGDASPEVLSFRAREMLTALGYPDRGRDHAVGFDRDLSYLVYDRNTRPAAGRIERLSQGRPAALQFWYRESPAPLAALVGIETAGPPEMPPVSLENPPSTRPEMRYLRLDTKGRLIEFGARPIETDTGSPVAGPMDWSTVFRLAGFEQSAFTPAQPSWTPPVACDARAAWTGVYPEQPDITLRLEAAANRGRLVAFRLIGPWPELSSAGPDAVVTAMGLTISLTAALLAWINVRSGRGDRRGAMRVGLVILVLSLLGWALSAHHVVAPVELRQIRHAVALALFAAANIYLAYLAVEPHVRRRWPAVLVAWSRVLSGRVRDPLVGREALAGIALGTAAAAIGFAAAWTQGRTMDADTDVINNFLSFGPAAGAIVTMPLASLATALLFTVFLLIFKGVLRNELLASTAATLAAVAIGINGSGAFGAVITGSIAIGLIVALTRFGLVAVITFLLATAIFAQLRAALAWSAGIGAFILAILIALTLAAAWLAIGSPRLLPRATTP